MTESPVIRELTEAEFQEFPGVNGAWRGRIPSPQLLAIRALTPGHGILLSHGLHYCKGGSCSIHHMANRESKSHPDRLYSVRHSNGQGSDVAVWCAVKE